MARETRSLGMEILQIDMFSDIYLMIFRAHYISVFNFDFLGSYCEYSS